MAVTGLLHWDKHNITAVTGLLHKIVIVTVGCFNYDCGKNNYFIITYQIAGLVSRILLFFEGNLAFQAVDLRTAHQNTIKCPLMINRCNVY